MCARAATFRDDDTNQALARDGYALLDRRIGREVVEQLTALYEGALDEVGRDGSGRFLPSMVIDRADVRARLWDGVAALVGPSIDPLFQPGTTTVFGGSFVSKPGSENSVRTPHQDPTVFDERAHLSLSVWIPLRDSGPENGTLHVLAGSHRMGNHVRPPDVESLDEDVWSIALERSLPLTVEAGQMVVLDGEVVHHSPPNESGVERLAAICALRPNGFGMRHLRSDAGADRGVAEVFEVDLEFYRSGNLISPDLDDAVRVGTEAYRPASVADLEASLIATGHAPLT